MPNSLLIENATVLSGGATSAVLANHSVLVEEGLIVHVAPQKRLSSFKGKRLDATGQVLMPGLVNAHTHFYSAFARGLTKVSPSKNFGQVLKNLWWRLDSALSLEDTYYSAMVGLLEAIRHGTTTLFDHHASPQAIPGSLQTIGRAVQESGLRACLCYEVSDRDGARIAQQGLEENANFIRQLARNRNQRSGSADLGAVRQDSAVSQICNVPGGRKFQRAGACSRPAGYKPAIQQTTSLRYPEGQHLAGLFGLHASFTLKDGTLAKAAELGAQLGCGFHIHLAEAASDQHHARRQFGRRVVQRLEQFGILGPKTLAAHCVHVNEREMERLAATKTTVVHNPQSNLNNAVGVADVLGLMKRGVQVGLGTDAMTTHMLEELRVGLWAQHIANENPSVGFSELVSTLWLNNPAIAQRTFHLPLGQVRPGYAADLILLNYDPPTPLTRQNSYGHLVYGLSQAAVDTTIVGGRVLMERGRLTLNLDEARLNARARELAQKLWNRL